METLDVLYTVNKNYIDIMLGSAISLILNGNVNNLRIHIIGSDFELEDFHKIEKTLYEFLGVELYFYDAKSFELEKFNIPSWRGSQIANARLFYQEYLAGNLSFVDNLLYLDADTIVVSDLQGLYEYRNEMLGAVRDEISNKYLKKLGGISNYFNSGVLFFNPDLWTSNNAQEKIIHFLENCNVPITFPDQDVLCCSLDGSITELPLKYNLGSNAYSLSPSLQRYYYDKKSGIPNRLVEEAKKDPKILHSTGFLGLKPWIKNDINPYNEEFMKYILMVNPNFQRFELSNLKKLLTLTPSIYKLFFIIKMNMPDRLKDVARKLVK